MINHRLTYRITSPKTFPAVTLGSTVIAILVLIVYLPDLKSQFFDGWWYLIWAGTMSFPRYLLQYFDPAYVTWTYRPLQGLYIYLLYRLFGSSPDGYHLAQILLHAANSILLFLNVWQLGRNQRVAIVAGILYAVLPTYALAVFWHAVADPLAAFFYLSSVFLWVRYLQVPRKAYWTMAFLMCILALLSKEISVFLPMVLFLIEWCFFKNRPNLQDIRKYIPFMIALFPYLWLLLLVQSRGAFVGQFGFKIGPHMLGNLMPYLAVLVYPWFLSLPTSNISYLWLAIAAAVYLIVMIRKRSLHLLLLGTFAILSIAPLSGFPQDYAETRYLYVPAMSSAVILALLVEIGRGFLRWNVGSVFLASLVVALLVVVSGQGVSEASTELAEATRQIRVPFRDISLQHPNFSEDTYLYFIYTSVAAISDFEGLFFLRYGTHVIVDGTNEGQPPGGHPADLYSHRSAYVYYFDSTGKPVESPVERAVSTISAPSLPARFQAPIVLEEYKVASRQVEPGKALILILDWRATSRIEKNYAVFAHIIDDEGNVISSYDAEPGRGKSPTSGWQPNQLLVDPIVLPLDRDARVGGSYRLEVGLFDPASGKLLNLLDANDQVVGTAIVIRPISIVPLATPSP